MSQLAVLSNGLDCTIALNGLGMVVTMIMICRIYLRFVVRMSMGFKKVVHPVGLGDAQEEQKQRG